MVDLRLYCAEDSFLVDTDADLRDKAIQSFRRYIIADQVEIEPLDLYAAGVPRTARPGTAGEDAAHRFAGNAGV